MLSAISGDRKEQEEIVLIEPTATLKEEFLSMTEEYKVAGETYNYHETARNDFHAFLRILKDESQGVNLPPGFVPMNTFWMVRNGNSILGESRLRHLLTPALEVEGGHIGYAIRPLARRKGYGILILALTLEKARELGLERVMVTCDTDNIASARIIEKNGGLLSGSAISPRSGKPVSQYWIQLK